MKSVRVGKKVVAMTHADLSPLDLRKRTLNSTNVRGFDGWILTDGSKWKIGEKTPSVTQKVSLKGPNFI